MAVSEGTILRVVPTILFPDDVVAQAVFHIVLTTIVGSGDATEVVDDMSQWMQDAYVAVRDYMATDMVSGEVKVYEYDPVDEDFDEVGTGSLGVNFTGAGEWLPHGVALVQNYYGQDPDVQGRKYLFGFLESVQADGDWTGPVLAAATAFAQVVVEQVIGDTASNEYQPVIWSPTKGVAVLYSGVVASNATVGYQRRRKPGVGI